MRYNDAIASVESGGRYDALGPVTRNGDRAYGKYQVMGANIGPWTKEVFGRPLSAQEFVANPEAQDAVFNAKFGYYVQKYGPEGAARAWFAGERGMHNQNARDALGTSVADYAAKFNKAAGMSNKAQGLPPGFVVDEESQQSGGLPPGFVLDDGEPPQPVSAKQDAPQASLLQKALEPITSYPQTYHDMRREGAQQLATGVDQISRAASGEDAMGYPVESRALEAARGAGNAVLGGIGYLASPINAALRTFAGKPVEENFGVPKEYTEFATSLAIPGVGMTRVSSVKNAAPALRPGERVVQAGQNLDNIGTGGAVEVPRAVASDSMATQRAASTVGNVPVVGNPIVKAADRTVSQLAQKAQDVAGEYGSASVHTAGEAASGSIKHWITGKSAAQADRLYERVDNLVDPRVTRPLEITKAVAEEIFERRAAAHLPMGKALEMVGHAIESPGLTYQGVKDLRSALGEIMSNKLLPEGMSQADLKRLYSALSDDKKIIASAAGGQRAVAALERADKYYKLVSDRRGALAKIVGADGNVPSEKVFERLVTMAGNTSAADMGKLAQARKAMGADSWNEVASGLISRMGRAEDATGNVIFSPQKFLTAYQDKLSPAGRAMLFRSAGKENIAPYLDDIATITTRFRQLQRFSNPSGTGQNVAGAAGLAGLWVEPMSAIGAAVGTNMLARVLATPATVAPAAQWSRKYSIALQSPTPAHVAQLTIASRNLANTINAEFGASVGWQDLLKATQGAVPARADKEEQKP